VNKCNKGMSDDGMTILKSVVSKCARVLLYMTEIYSDVRITIFVAFQ
jgi:hypothetical protein